jgi:hypothetical protein
VSGFSRTEQAGSCLEAVGLSPELGASFHTALSIPELGRVVPSPGGGEELYDRGRKRLRMCSTPFQTRMRFIIMHKTSAHWEAGAMPSQELITRVGNLIGELVKANAMLSGEGLRASSHRVRLTFSGGRRTITKGPVQGEHELPAGFTILRVKSLDEAIEWASRQAKVTDCGLRHGVGGFTGGRRSMGDPVHRGRGGR